MTTKPFQPVRDLPTAAAATGSPLSLSIRILIPIATALVYIGLFYPLHVFTGPALCMLMALPVALSGWMLGRMAGTLIALVGVGLNLLLLATVGWLDWPHILQGNVLTGSLIILLVGFLLGQLRQLMDRADRELGERSKAEQRQKNAASLLKSTLDATADGILFIDTRGNIIVYNLKFAAMWGLNAEDLHQSSLTRRMDDMAGKVRNRAEFIDNMRLVLEQQNQEYHFTLFLTDGQVLKCLATPQSLDASGHKSGMVLSFQDITDLKQKNDALLKSEKKVRILIDNSVDGISLIDEQGRVIEWNPAQEAITGLESGAVLGRPFWEVMHELLPPESKYSTTVDDLRAWLREKLVALQAGDEPHTHLERDIFRPDRHTAFVEGTFFLIRADRGFMLGLICRDVTSRRQADEALRERHEMSQTILNAYPDMAVLLDVTGRVLAVNDPFAASVGVPAQEIVGSNLYRLLQPQEAARVRQQGMYEAILSGLPAVREMTQNGRWYSDTFFPISNGNGTVARVALFTRDVTDSRQRERELEAVASISSALRAALTRDEVYPIILDQIETLLDADGIGLVLRDPETGDVQVEQARGVWSSLNHMHYPPDQATRGPILILKEPYLNNEIETSLHMFQTRPYTGLKATACVPLEIEGNIIGSLWIGRKTEINQDDVRILSALAHTTANAIHRVSLYEQTREYADQLALGSETGRELGETLSLSEIYPRLSQSIYRMLPSLARILITRFDPETQEIVYVYGLQDSRPLDVSVMPRLPLRSPDECDQSRAIHTRQPFVKNDCKLYLNGPSSPPVLSTLIVPLVVKGEALGALQLESYTSRRFGKPEVQLLTLIGNTAAIAIQNGLLFENLQQSHENLTLAYETTLEGWARALDLRDHGTHDHTHRVVDLAVGLGRRLGMNDAELTNLRRGAQLHDIGKMGVPDSILLKPGPLTEEEWKVMRLHPVYAYEMLYPVPEFRKILDIPYCHHEKWDGTGYPRELSREEIPLPARIFSIVDVWDALCSDRPYRNAWPEEKVISYLKSQAGRQFDPQVVTEFLEMVKP